jgi:DNA ligase-associated metallophosphoesterase
MLSIEWMGERFDLLPQRAAYRRRNRTLLIADVHLGKPDAFIAAGVPVPNGSIKADLYRLAASIERTGAARLIVLGDLLHARAGRTSGVIDRFRAWRVDHHRLEIVLVRGNHDRSAGDPPDEWRIDCVDEPMCDDGMLCAHQPVDDGEMPNIAGHVHPAIVLHDRDGFRRRVRCFRFGERSALLPAFGSFTGGKVIEPDEGDRIFAVDEEEVIDVTRLVGRSSGTRVRM